MGDWSDPIYVTSQIFVICAYCLVAWTYLIKKRTLLLFVIMAASLTMGIGFGLLSAWVGVGMCVIAITRDTVSELLNRKRNETDKNRITKLDCALLAVWLTAQIVVTYFTSEGFMSWFALFATMTFTISIWQKNKIVYNFMGIIVGVFWIIYNFFIESLFSIILESVLLVFVVAGAILSVVKYKMGKNG
jgi:hypothetical protein